MENGNTTEFLTKGLPIRLVVGITCFLSIVGATLIILSYACFKSLRTKSREILLHLSLMDLGVAAANFIGDVVYFDQFYHIKNNTLIGPISTVQNLCKAQAFFAIYFTLGSVLWTISLAVYLYFLLVHRTTHNAKYFLYFSYVFCWGMPFFIALWLVLTGRLGYSPYNSAGWCSMIAVKPKTQSKDYFAVVMGYDLWIYLAMVLVPVMYCSVRWFLREEVSAVRTMDTTDMCLVQRLSFTQAMKSWSVRAWERG